LHDREGEWRDNVSRTYDIASTPALQELVGESISGDWQLRVRDLAQADQGRFNAWSMKFWY
jgi:subtilisin-like proprotein convertase family protein